MDETKRWDKFIERKADVRKFIRIENFTRFDSKISDIAMGLRSLTSTRISTRIFGSRSKHTVHERAFDDILTIFSPRPFTIERGPYIDGSRRERERERETSCYVRRCQQIRIWPPSWPLLDTVKSNLTDRPYARPYVCPFSSSSSSSSLSRTSRE